MNHKPAILVAKPSDAISSVLGRMKQSNVGSILIAENNIIQGIFTERDLLKNWDVFTTPENLSKNVSEFMTKNVHSVTVDNISSAAQIMIEGGFRHLPIVDKQDKLVGILSLRDLLKTHVKKEHEAAERKKNQTSSLEQHVLHIVTPTFSIEPLCKNILGPSWKIVSWQRIQPLLLSKELSKADARASFLIDLDGLEREDWLEFLKKLIPLLSKQNQPRVVLIYAPQNILSKDLDTVRKIAKTAEWKYFERPIDLGAFAQTFTSELLTQL